VTNGTGIGGLEIVDPHHHLWDLDNHHYSWLQDEPADAKVCGDTTPIRRSYLLEDFLADARDVRLTKSVHIENGWSSGDPVDETRWLQTIADHDGFPHGIVAYAALESATVKSDLERHAEFGNVRGIRQILNWHPDPKKTFVDRADYLVDADWQRGFRLLARYNLSFDLQIYPSQMRDAARLAHANPDVQIVLDHAGMPLERTATGVTEWQCGMRLLAKSPNVFAKISGLGMLDWTWTVETIRPWVLQTIDVFGPSRCMFASNFPVDKLYGDYTSLWTAFAEIVSTYTSQEQFDLFSGTATRVYRL
jgi:predicted TIM-barrel fold metal-dependent hydrolase